MKIPAFLTICSLCLSPLLLTADSLHENSIPTDVSQKSKPATLKVLLEKLSEDVLLEVKGRYLVYNPQNDILIESGITGKRARMTVSDNGLVWGELFPGANELRIVPGDSQSSILINGVQYKGCVEIYSVGEHLTVINEVDIENYLKATFAASCAHIPEELLEIVAVVSRTNLYYLARKNKEATWHVDAQKVSYAGGELSRKSSYAENAVDKTKHMVLTFDDQPFPAVWTKDSAGKTASYASIFRKGGKTPPGAESLPSGFFRTKNTWTLTVEKERLAEIAHLDVITKIDLFHAEKSGKIYAIRLSNGSEAKNIDFFTLQHALGSDQLKSNDFSIKADQDHITFSGYGQGIGVGLCLASAEILAKRRENPRKILKTFFPGTQLVSMRTLDAKEPLSEEKISAAWQ